MLKLNQPKKQEKRYLMNNILQQFNEDVTNLVDIYLKKYKLQ